MSEESFIDAVKSNIADLKLNLPSPIKIISSLYANKEIESLLPSFDPLDKDVIANNKDDII